MAIDYDKLLYTTPIGQWVTGEELEKSWKVTPIIRKARAKVLVTRGFLLRRGKTANVQYKLAGKGSKKETKAKAKPDTTLDELIKAATTVGSENAIMRKALEEAKAIITKALEVNK